MAAGWSLKLDFVSDAWERRFRGGIVGNENGLGRRIWGGDGTGTLDRAGACRVFRAGQFTVCAVSFTRKHGIRRFPGVRHGDRNVYA